MNAALFKVLQLGRRVENERKEINERLIGALTIWRKPFHPNQGDDIIDWRNPIRTTTQINN